MIRSMEKADLPEVMRIWLETNVKAHDFISEEYWRKNAAAVQELLPKAEVYVYEAENDAAIAGFLGMTDNYIAGIFVCGQAQSNGIGKRLLCFAKEKKERLTLHIYRKNERAVRFYQREGFLRRGEAVDERTKEAEIFMEWEKK